MFSLLRRAITGETDRFYNGMVAGERIMHSIRQLFLRILNCRWHILTSKNVSSIISTNLREGVAEQEAAPIHPCDGVCRVAVMRISRDKGPGDIPGCLFRLFFYLLALQSGLQEWN